jgi:Cys-tRNA(Pro)/Cys-tRNA(Cys) deacylase
MAKKIEKTNAARLLDKAGINYGLIPYEFDENDLAVQHVAECLGQPIEQVFKTLVLQGDKTGHIVCVVPGDSEVDLKALAKASGNKKVEMIAMKDLLAVTGYIRGGCSPVGMKKRFPTYFHSTAMEFERIYVSAGVRGLQLQIAPSELIAFVGGIVADVASID